MASQAVSAGPVGTEECRKCRYARAALRALAYMAVGVVVALALSWAIRIVPWLGVLLGFLSTLLLVRTLLRIFFRPSPAKALLHLGISMALGLAVAFVLALVLG